MAQGALGIGPWQLLLEAMAYLSVMNGECEIGTKEVNTGSEGELEVRDIERWLRRNKEVG